MSSRVTNYKCPACGGPLHFDGTSGKLQCDYCDSSFPIDEVEAMMEEKTEEALQETEAAEASKDDWPDTESSEWGKEAEGMKVYSCPSCGAELICDQNTAATCCPYCGNQTIIPSQFTGALKPKYVIPFKTDKAAAKAALKNHYKGKKLLPNSFERNNHIEDIQGVYVPFWLFDCEAEGYAKYEATTKTTEKSGNEEITTTRYYDVARAGNMKFEKVPVDASSRMPDAHMDSIEPYDYEELKEFSLAYMPGFLADKYDVDADQCKNRMEERCAATFFDEMDRTVTGYDTVNCNSKSVAINEEAVHYAMLPAWLLATKWNNQQFLFAMNGQTGKIVGDLPVDQGKYWKYLGITAVILIALMQLLNYVILSNPMTGVTMVVVTILLPIIIAFIYAGILKSNMKSVRSQKAAAYISGHGLRLTQRYDTFTRSTTQTKTLHNNNER